MRLTLTVVRPAAAGADPAAVEVEVDAADGSTAGQLVEALTALADGTSPTPMALFVGGRRLPDDDLVGRPPLVDGAAVTLRPAGDAPTGKPEPGAGGPPPVLHARSRRAPVVLTLVHGPDAGRSVDLHPGTHTIGRSPDADIVVDDDRLSRVHAELTVTTDGVWVRDLGSTNGTRLDGVLLEGTPSRARAGASVTLGGSVLELGPSRGAPAVLERHPDGTTAVNRRARPSREPPPVSIALPTPPDPPRGMRVPWVAALVPIPVAAVMAVLFGPMMLAFAVMGPVVMLGSTVADRVGSRRTYAAEAREHARLRNAALARVDDALREEVRRSRRANPDPAEVLAIAAGPTARVWERRRDDPDAMAVSVGTCSTPSRLRVIRPSALFHASLPCTM